MEDILILDNSPISYLFQKQNALPIKTWLDDKNDIELYKYLRLLEYLATVNDVRDVISQIVNQQKNQIDFDIFDQIVSQNSLNVQNVRAKNTLSETRKLWSNRVEYNNMLEVNPELVNKKSSKSKGTIIFSIYLIFFIFLHKKWK